MFVEYFILSSVTTLVASVNFMNVGLSTGEVIATAGDPLPQSNLSSPLREQILNFYNMARGSTIPTSSNTPIVTWNDELARVAEAYVRKCDLSLVNGSEFPENTTYKLFSSYVVKALKGSNETVTVQAILDHTIDDTRVGGYQYGNDTCKPGSECLIYVNLIKADVHEIGCALHSCEEISSGPPGNDGAYSFVCIHGLKTGLENENGSIILPYEQGEPCSNCPTRFPYCDSDYSLCSAFPSVFPTGLEIEKQPGPQNTPAKEPFAEPALINLIGEDKLFLDFAYPGCAWYVGVLISSGSYPHAELLGKTDVQVVDGRANFTDLGISKQGEYVLMFYISYPNNITDDNFVVFTNEITISPPLEQWESCEVQEGENRFERFYQWKPDCSEVCISDCEGGDLDCVDLVQCGPHATCIDDECVCKDRYSFDYNVFDEDFLEDTVNPIVKCMPNHMEIKLDKCGLNAMGYNLGNMYIFGPGPDDADINAERNIDDQIYPFIEACEFNDCRGHVTADSDGVSYSFMIQSRFLDCNGHVETNDTHIMYTHTVRGYGGIGNHVISRKRHLHVTFTCSYLRSLWSTVELFVSPFIKIAKLNLISTGSFDIGFGLWEDSSYLLPITEPPMIQIPNPIYVGIYAKNVEVVLFAEYCYVTLTVDMNDTVAHDLIVDGCSVDRGTTVIPQSGENSEALFSFESFAFDGHRNSTTMFLHCKVRVCATDMAPCTASCQARKRRASHSTDVSTMLSLGPITLVNTQRKRRAIDDQYASSFPSEYATQELANPPFARTTGRGASFLTHSI